MNGEFAEVKSLGAGSFQSSGGQRTHLQAGAFGVRCGVLPKRWRTEDIYGRWGGQEENLMHRSWFKDLTRQRGRVSGFRSAPDTYWRYRGMWKVIPRFGGDVGELNDCRG